MIKLAKGNRSFRPILIESAATRYAAFAFLYLAQGIPYGTLSFAIPAWMAMKGHSAGEIGALVGITLLPWSLKIFFAPVMDRFTYLPMGRRRPWVLFGQLGIIACFVALAALPDPLSNLSTLMVLCFIINCFTAIQDVATDGMAIDVIPVAEQARANGLMWGAKTIGTFGSLAICTALFYAVGFQWAMLIWALVVAWIFLIPLCLRERAGEKILPFTPGEASATAAEIQLHSWRSIVSSIWQVVKLPTSIFFAIIMFVLGIGDGLFDASFPIFSVQHLGWTDSEYSNLTAIINICAGLGGMVIGGLLVDRFGKRNMLTIYLVVMISVTVAMGLTRSYWLESGFAATFMSIYYTYYVFQAIALFAVAMQLCWKRVAATQFTLYMASKNFGTSAGPAALGIIRTHWDWTVVFFIFAGLLCIALGLISLLRIKSHTDKVIGYGDV